MSASVDMSYEDTFAIHLAGGTTIDGHTFRKLLYGKTSVPQLGESDQALLHLCLSITRTMLWGGRLTVADIIQNQTELPGCLSKPPDDEPARPLYELVDALEEKSNGTIILYTSGTTGRPKAVEHNFQSLGRGIQRSSSHRNDRWATGFVPAHMAGVQVFLQALCNGNPILFLQRGATDSFLERIGNLKITHISATPTFYRLLPLKGEITLPEVRHLSSGGEAWDSTLPGLLKCIFPNATWHNIYATTEAGSLFISRGDIFTLRPKWEGKVKVEGDHLLLAGELLGQMPRKGCWYNTGDLVEVLSDHPLRVRFIRRENEEVNIAGYKVNPHDVERVLKEHEAIQNARVYARENKVTGRVLMADVVYRHAPLPEKTLRNFLSSQLDTYHIPRVFRTVTHLEQTLSGKIKR